MSTYYYRLRSPIVRLSPDPERGDRMLLVARDDRHEGDDAQDSVIGSIDSSYLNLVVDRDELAALITGRSTTVYATGPDAEQVVSEYGDLTTLGVLRRGVRTKPDAGGAA